MSKITLYPVLALSCFSPMDQQPPAPPSAEIVEAHGNGVQVACELHRQFSAGADGANVFFSPASITSALAMVAEGAGGETAVELGRVLQGEDALDVDSLRAVMQDLALRLKAASANDGVRWREANGIWADDQAALIDSTQEALELHHGAAVRPADFRGAPDKVRKEINRWVENQTDDLIKDLLPSGSVDELTRLVLVNAVYFLGKWEDEFKKDKTAELPFALADGTEVFAPFLQDSREVPTSFFDAEGVSLPTTDGAALSVFELPYKGGQLSFVGIVPASADGLTALEERLDANLLKQWLGALVPRKVQFSMPKLKLAPSYDLVPVLKAIGLGSAMDPDRADLNGFFGPDGQDLHVTGAFHKAFLEVDEAGTKAAAATGVVVGVRSAMARPLRVSADRPYLFLIRERSTGAVLFMGRITNPLR